MNGDFWRGRRVVVTGHTGFKGGWLTLWLTDLGAEVHGYALQPPTEPNFFTIAGLHQRVASSTIADIRDTDALAQAIDRARPEVVLHLAAQPLVRRSYEAPVDTYAINVVGTINLLEAVRRCPGVRAVVNVTTDKCYENREGRKPYLENEPLGGHDPYSSSKACSEIVTAAYRRSFLSTRGIHVATARAGNVIGGGDWAADRLVPDFLRAFDRGEPLVVRSPDASRPWQHVLEPLCGYLTLAERLYSDGEPYAEPWNFGPESEETHTVRWVVERLCALAPGAAWRQDRSPHPHEAATLALDSGKARERLAWRSRWSVETALKRAIAWHLQWKAGADMAALTVQQIAEYSAEGEAVAGSA